MRPSEASWCISAILQLDRWVTCLSSNSVQRQIKYTQLVKIIINVLSSNYLQQLIRTLIVDCIFFGFRIKLFIV